MRTTIGVDGIDALIEGGVPRGAAVLVAGEPGTGKTVLSIQFVLAGIRDGEPGVLATAAPVPQLMEAASALGWDLGGAVEDGYARVVTIGADPSLTAPGGAAAAGQAAGAAVAAAAEEIRAERVAIDPALVAVPGQEPTLAEFLATLVRTTREQTGCTTLLTGQRARGATGYTRLGIEEQVADGIVDLSLVERDGQRTRVLAVHSMLGTNIDLDNHPFAIIGGRGIVVGE